MAEHALENGEIKDVLRKMVSAPAKQEQVCYIVG